MPCYHNNKWGEIKKSVGASKCFDQTYGTCPKQIYNESDYKKNIGDTFAKDIMTYKIYYGIFKIIQKYLK